MEFENILIGGDWSEPSGGGRLQPGTAEAVAVANNIPVEAAAPSTVWEPNISVITFPSFNPAADSPTFTLSPVEPQAAPTVAVEEADTWQARLATFKTPLVFAAIAAAFLVWVEGQPKPSGRGAL